MRKQHFNIFEHFILNNFGTKRHFSMPTYCLGCLDQKRSKDSKFYNASSLSLVAVNNLRQTFNMRKRKLKAVSEIPVASKICKSCYDMTHNNAIVSIDLNEPDLTIYRKGLHSHTQCTFGCKTLGNLVSVPKTTRTFLLMNYKFLVLPSAQMCVDHFAVNCYWPLVKQITREVPDEDQKQISDLMFNYNKAREMITLLT